MAKMTFSVDDLPQGYWYNPISKYFIDKGVLFTCDSMLYYNAEDDEVVYRNPKRTIIVPCWALQIWYNETFKDPIW